MKWILESLAETLSPLVSMPAEAVQKLFRVEANAERGDLALPCFPFAKALKQKPDAIAQTLAESIAALDAVEQAEAAGPFLNIRLKLSAIAEHVFTSCLDAPDSFGQNQTGEGKTVVLDFSSPNIAKPIAFHHIRSTVIGNALANLHEACGWKTVRINYLGDWGTTQGKLISAFRRFGSADALQADPIKHLLEIYVRFHQEAETQPELLDEAKALFKNLEDGDASCETLWTQFRELSIREFRRIYDRMGIRFDHYDGESLYRHQLDETVEEVTQKAGAKIDQGALIVDLSDKKLPPCLLRKDDGATLYATRDIAATKDRHERFSFDRSLYVVASQQTVYFQQLFEVLKRMDFDYATRCEHIPFGMLQLADKTMSTRKGQVIFLEDVLDKAVALSREAIAEKNPNLNNADQVAEQVGIGAIIFGDLVAHRKNDVTFEWSRILDFKGKTGVYVQYTHARCRSMLRKGEMDADLKDSAQFTRPEEKEVLKGIAQFPDMVQKATDSCDPSLIANHLVNLCQSFNSLFSMGTEYRFLDDNPALRSTRLSLVLAVATTLKNGLQLLGLATPEEM